MLAGRGARIQEFRTPRGEGNRSRVDLVHLTRGKRRWVVLQIGSSFLEGGCEAAILTLFARLALSAVDSDTDTLYVPGIGYRSLSVGLFVLVALIGVRFLAGLSTIFLSNRIQYSLVKAVRHSALTAYSGSSWLAQSKFDDGAMQQLMVTLPSGISGQLSNLITHLGHVVIMGAMLGFAMFADARLTSFLIVVLVVATVLFRPLRALIKRASARVLTDQRVVSSGVAELTAVRLELQTFGLMEKASILLHGQVESEADQSERLSRLKGAVVPLFTTVTYLAVALSILILISSDTNSFDRTGPILLVVLRSLSYGTAVQQAATSISSLRPSIDLFVSRVSELQAGEMPWGDKQLGRLESLQFDAVNFAYPGSERDALEHVSLSISRGMRVGLVGPSGSGKTTITRLMLGLVEPQGGRLLVNGEELHSFDRASWSRQVGVVPQLAHVLTGSVAENLRFYRSGISDEDLWEALEIADLRDEIAAMPCGLNTLVGPGHRALSGGQQQRLSIARAFAARPEFVVMDEPTSSIDALSEGAVSDAIDNLPSGVTVLIVSHRMRILRGCDMLVVVEAGRISAVGKPEEVESNSVYLQSLDGE